MPYQQGKKISEMKILKKVPGNQILNKPIYILTSDKTASGCEAVAYTLQNRERAIVIGEVTMGASHAVKSYDIIDKFKMFMPISSMIDPLTETNFEVIGVKPKILCASENALKETLSIIKN